MEQEQQTQNYIKITAEPLDLLAINRLVQRDTAGAIVNFIGTTRDSFEGKQVESLEYEAYVPMAEKEMLKLCQHARSQWDLQGIAIFHRIELVPVGEASVIISVSSAHRADALQACTNLIDRLKETVPIWKKERYSDGTCSWKQNCPGCTKHKQQQ
uniref:Molybdopterin synthase catalytic subunit n=1 Tax=Vannella robusta TaxID=1487602 RepID=A0A7S4HHC5_9EUKA|mmetsp:Transcript_1047/g.1288  ORF Transcript_1047/g.1288 Transcript_1047/m.1288 type:complete len:156 (+) Transcript_1047:833-1300(+)